MIERRYPRPDVPMDRRPPQLAASRGRRPSRSPRWSEPDVKLSVMQENLARGLSVVSRAVSNRSTLPVLANVLLKTEDAGLKLTATNLEIGITYWVPGQDRDRRRDDRPGQAPDRPRQLAPERRAGRPRRSSRPTSSTSRAAGSRRTSRASTPTSSRPSAPPASDRRRGSPRTSCAGPWPRPPSPRPATRLARS